MRLIKIENLQEGDILAYPIYDQYSNLIAKKTDKINLQRIEFLKKFGIKELIIEDESDVVIKHDELISQTSIIDALKKLKTKDMKQISNCAKMLVIEFIGNHKSDIMIDEPLPIRNDFDRIYQRAIQVCKYALAVSKNMKIDDAVFLYELAVSSLLHNLGESFLEIESVEIKDPLIRCYYKDYEKKTKKLDEEPDEEKLDEDEIVQNYFYTDDTLERQKKYSNIYLVNYLKDNPYLNKEILYTVMSYKENLDGTGFPFRYKADQIPLSARIIRVCSDFDTLVNENNMTEKEAILKMQELKGINYDDKVLNTLSRTVAIYKKGTLVDLSDGLTGLVYENHLAYPDKPTVILEDGTLLNLKDEIDNIEKISIIGYKEENRKSK